VPERARGIGLTPVIPEEEPPPDQPKRKCEGGEHDGSEEWGGLGGGDMLEHIGQAHAPQGPEQEPERDSYGKESREHPPRGPAADWFRV
jgi:hypothetical protein